MIRRRSKQFLVLLSGVALVAIWAGVSTSVSSAQSTKAGGTKCNRTTQATARAADPLSKETAFLTQKNSEGWALTAAGQSIAAGGVPPGASVQANGGLGGIGEVVVATKSATSGSPLRHTQSATRTSGFITDVYLWCLSAQTANIDYEVHDGSTQFVKWQEHNITTGADRTRNGPGTACPVNPPGDCLIYAYDSPGSPWAVQKGSIYVDPTSAWKWVDLAYCS